MIETDGSSGPTTPIETDKASPPKKTRIRARQVQSDDQPAEPEPSDEGLASLDRIQYETVQHELDTLRQVLRERVELHGLRRLHTWILLGVSLAWIWIIRNIVLNQGLALYDGKPFHLTDTVLVTFISSTTGTVLGLYGIAAYWLYGRTPKQDANAKSKKGRGLAKKPSQRRRTERTSTAEESNALDAQIGNSED